jgi:hypothetical protein
MSATKTQKRDELLGVVREALQRAEGYCGKIRPWDSRLSVISILCGAVATVLAGGAVAGGKPAMEAIGGWKILCSIVAVLTASGTAAGALHKTLQFTTRVSNAEKCIARLRALEAAMAATDMPTDEAMEKFQRISEEHAVCLA